MQLNFTLHEAQLEIFNADARFKVVAAGRRFGKSYLSAIMLLIEALKDKSPSGQSLGDKDVYYVAPTYQQGKDILWRLIKDLGRPVIAKAWEVIGVIELINGRRIHIKGSDRPDTLRGVGLSYVVLDEYAFMKPDTWETIIRPTLSDVEGGAMFIGTPSGKNHFFRLFQEFKDDSDWALFQYHSTQNPYLPQGEVEVAKRNLSSSAYKQEYEASFSTQSGLLLNPKHIVVSDESIGGQIYMTMDPAGFKDVAETSSSKLSRLDETAIAVVEVGTEGWHVHDIVHGRWDIRETSVRLLRLAQVYRPARIGIEKGALMNALMPYLEDQKARLGVFPLIEPVTHGNQRKVDRITWALQGRLEHGRITFKDGPYLETLVDQMGDFPSPLAHDDLVDALAYIDQVAVVAYAQDIDDGGWESMDNIIGF